MIFLIAGNSHCRKNTLPDTSLPETDIAGNVLPETFCRKQRCRKCRCRKPTDRNNGVVNTFITHFPLPIFRSTLVEQCSCSHYPRPLASVYMNGGVVSGYDGYIIIVRNLPSHPY